MNEVVALILVALIGVVLGVAIGYWARDHRDELLPPAQRQAVDEIAPRPAVETKVVPQFGAPEVKAAERLTLCAIDGEDILPGSQMFIIPVKNSSEELHICLSHVHTGEESNA